MPFREDEPSLMRMGINRSPKKLLTYLRASLFPSSLLYRFPEKIIPRRLPFPWIIATHDADREFQGEGV